MKILRFVGLFFLVLSIFFISSLLILSYSLPKIENNISILILGKGGEGHTAPDLTDTIMVAFLNPKIKKTSFLSLPRDIWVSEIKAKLNTAYYYGGFKMASESVESIVGIKPNYTLVVDFSLFKDLINTVGGIDVVIDNSFIDQKYPIAGLENDLCNGDRVYACRYETVEFRNGPQKMDGELALKFVRSRNAKGDEGTDLAREKRQQKVINAIKDKLLSSEIILNPKAIKKLYAVLASRVETDITLKEIPSFLRFVFETKFNVNFVSIPEDLLKVSRNDKKYDNQYVFLPTSSTWEEIQEWVKTNI